MSTKIEWTDMTWNPVTGCWGPGGTEAEPKWCRWCFARRQARRLKGFGQAKYAEGFRPAMHTEALEQMRVWLTGRRRPRRIFVVDMGDLWGGWVPEEWIDAVLDVARGPGGDVHSWQFLTENPERYLGYSPFPPNFWMGATATDQASWDRAAWALPRVSAPVRFISAEPLRECIVPGRWLPEWLIIGGMSGPGATPPPIGSDTELAVGYRILGMTPVGATPPPISPPTELAMRLRLPRDRPPPALFIKNNLGWVDPPQDFPEVTP